MTIDITCAHHTERINETLRMLKPIISIVIIGEGPGEGIAEFLCVYSRSLAGKLAMSKGSTGDLRAINSWLLDILTPGYFLS